ncbi:MAG: cobaltochelatase subunit CobN, partial [Pseudomonadota bacterium]|nr:cobaltochelatase subunit CobN [Pseudomonadota bacterium]
LSYWLAGSESNVEQMVRMLVDRYASGPRAALRGTVPAEPPVIYPDVGLYHPDLPGGFSEDPTALRLGEGPRVGLLLMRSYLLAGNTAHYDGVIRALEARGLAPVPIFASGLDARPAIDRFFLEADAPPIEVLLSLTGFSLVGGPAYNDSDAAEAVLKRLDVPYLAAHALEFQPIDQWQGSAQGLAPVEATIMVSIPELDGATTPTVFGGRPQGGDGETDMQPIEERVARLADRVAALAALRRTARAERRVGVVLFNFPPQGGAVGTAAHLSVWRSLAHTLASMKRAGYSVDAPEDPDALRRAVLQGNAARYGTDANVLATIPVDRYLEEEPHLEALEAAWGPAPGQ